MAKKTVVQVDEVDEDDFELAEEVEDEAPKAKKGKAAPAAEVEEIWGVRQLIAYIKAKTGTEYQPREVRTLLRKMAREGQGVNREIIPGNKTRYAWDGPKDPEVRAIIAQVKGGAIESAKKAALEKLKSDKAAKDAAKPKVAKKAAPVADDDDDEDDD